MTTNDWYYEDEPQAQPAPVDPRMDHMLQAYEYNLAEQQYEQEMSRVVTMHPDIDPDSFHVFVAAADGDFNLATEMHTRYYHQFGDGRSEQHAAPEQHEAPTSIKDTVASMMSQIPPR